MNPLLVASGVAGLIVGLLLVWRYLRREPERPVRGPYGTVRLDVRPLNRDHQLVEFV